MEWSSWNHGKTSMRSGANPLRTGGQKEPRTLTAQSSNRVNSDDCLYLQNSGHLTKVTSTGPRHRKSGFQWLIAKAFHFHLQNLPITPPGPWDLSISLHACPSPSPGSQARGAPAVSLEAPAKGCPFSVTEIEERLLNTWCARGCAKCCVYIMTFNPHLRQVLYYPISQMRQLEQGDVK